MKNTEKKGNRNIWLYTFLVSLVMIAGGATSAIAQNPFPAPPPAPGLAPSAGPGLAPAPGPGLAPSPGFGPGLAPGPAPQIILHNGMPINANAGVETVIACGYDAQGVWQTIPLHVSYQWNGVNYNVMVLNAWNPLSQSWNIGVDQQAFNTSYFLNGNTYDFYAPLTTGTYYFNL